MTKQEKRNYIIKTWNISSGKKISEMLKRYWTEKNAGDSSIETAKEVFEIK